MQHQPLSPLILTDDVNLKKLAHKHYSNNGLGVICLC